MTQLFLHPMLWVAFRDASGAGEYHLKSTESTWWQASLILKARAGGSHMTASSERKSSKMRKQDYAVETYLHTGICRDVQSDTFESSPTETSSDRSLTGLF